MIERVVVAVVAVVLIAAPNAAAEQGARAKGKGLKPEIRVGGPSAPNDTKVAIVGSSEKLAGDPFRVTGAGGATVLEGKLLPVPGDPGPWRRAFAADLSAVTTPGAYKVQVGKLKSKRPWIVGAGASAEPIRTMLRFFAAQNDGNEASPLHGPSHLNDAVVDGGPKDGVRYDLTGGWMDAGNQVKLVNTTAYTVLLLEASARLYPALAAELTATSDVGIRWLLKAHPEPGVFVAQVGDQRDSDRGFSNPAADDKSTKPGIGTRSAYTDTGADQAGIAAAALANGSLRFPGDVGAAIVQSAVEWYEYGSANERSGGASPLDDFYEDDTFEDNMAAGALGLYRATGDPQYLADAVDWVSGVDVTPGLNWGSIGSLVGADMCGVLGLPAVPDPARATGCELLRKAATVAVSFARNNAFGTPASFAHFGQTAENGGRGAIAALAERAGLVQSGLATAAGARDFLLGRNQWGASFVVGLGPGGGARNPHHWARIVKGPLFGPGEPVGAVVGGPTTPAIVREQELRLFPGKYKAFNSKGAVYEDHLDNYVTSEPALDYTVSSLFLLATLGG